MKSWFIKLAIILNCVICIGCYTLSMSIVDKSYSVKNKALFTDSYLDLKKPKKMILTNNRVCEICKEKVDIKKEIPYNCTIPMGCPFNRNTKNIIEDTFKG